MLQLTNFIPSYLENYIHALPFLPILDSPAVLHSINRKNIFTSEKFAIFQGVSRPVK